MPNALSRLNADFPDLAGKSDGEKIERILDYLYMLTEQLRYILDNLGAENMNARALEELGETIRRPVQLRLEDADGRLTDLQALAGGLHLQVENDTDRATLQLCSGSVRLGASQTIRFTGDVVFASDLAEGVTEISGDSIRSGTVDGARLLSRARERGAQLAEDAWARKVVQVDDGRVAFLRYVTDGSGRPYPETDPDYAPLELGALYYDDAGPHIVLTAENGAPLKLRSAAGLSLDAAAGDTVWIGTSTTAPGQNVRLGDGTGRVEILGDLEAAPCSPRDVGRTANRWQFCSDGKIYFNGQPYSPGSAAEGAQ